MDNIICDDLLIQFIYDILFEINSWGIIGSFGIVGSYNDGSIEFYDLYHNRLIAVSYEVSVFTPHQKANSDDSGDYVDLPENRTKCLWVVKYFRNIKRESKRGWFEIKDYNITK